MHQRFCIGSLLLSASFAAAASDWVALGLDRRGNAWHIDRASVVRDSSDQVSAWKRIAFREPSPQFGAGDPAVKVALVLDVTDCGERRADVRALKLLDENGAVVAHERGERGIEWPDGGHVVIQEKAMTLLCSDAWRSN